MNLKCVLLKEASVERVLRVSSHLHSILEEAKLQERGTYQWLSGAGCGGQGWTMRETHEGILRGVGLVPYCVQWVRERTQVSKLLQKERTVLYVNLKY